MGDATDKAGAFLALLQPLQRPLEVYCRRLLRDPSHVEDVLQAAVSEAFAKFGRYEEGANFRAWMFRFVTLEAFNRNRKREAVAWADAPLDPPAPEESEADDALEALLEDADGALKHLDDSLADALRGLAAPERAVLLLRAIGEFSYQEIGDLHLIPLGSVTGYLSRARRKLNRSLADYAAWRGWPSGARPGGRGDRGPW